MKRLLFVLLLLAALATSASAAWVDPYLEEQVAATDGDEYIHALVVMKDRVDLRNLNAGLAAEGASFARRHFEVITTYQLHADTTQAALRELLDDYQDQGLVRSYRTFWITNGIAIEAKAEVIDQLAARADVGWLFLDYPLELIEPVRVGGEDVEAARGIEPGIENSNAPLLWALGIDGTGVIVSSLDTGVEGDHPAFASRWRGTHAPVAETWYDPAGASPNFPYDYWGHGTHTMGTMCGEDGNNQIGMAPGAEWISAAVIDVYGVDIYTEGIAAFEWSADPDGDPNTTDDVPAVSSNSWGIPYTQCEDAFWEAIDVVEAAGVVVVFAAGNEGPTGHSLRSPADRSTTDFNAFSIGALQQGGTAIANFSSRGPSHCTGNAIKPEISAVGVAVRSAYPGGDYTEMDGTSMATPHVAGAVALLRQAFPEATVEDIKYALYYSAVDLGATGNDNVFGNGRMDVMAAYNFLLDSCDRDGDGYQAISCGGDDCDDLNDDSHPSAEEICDGLDNNCDGTVPANELDVDADGYSECEGDCEDDNPAVKPGAREICDGIDNNCDGNLLKNEIDPDGDGWFNCEGDCAPNNADVYPGATEICDGIDDSCDGVVPVNEFDHDGDGYSECAGDCEDTNAWRNPGVTEDCSDGVDNNCNDLVDGADPQCQSADDDADDDATTDDDQSDDDVATDDDNSADDDAGSGGGGCA